MKHYSLNMLHLCVMLFQLCLASFHKCTVLMFPNLCHRINSYHLFLYPLHVNLHRILLLVNISNARRAFHILKATVLDSWIRGGQGELVLEAFLNRIFGAEQPPRYRGRTAKPVCEGSSEVKVLHCTRQTASLSLSF